MSKYKILKSFKGSQDGRITETFEEGTERDLSPYLVSAVDPSCIEQGKKAPEPKNKAIKTDGKSKKAK